MNKHHHSSMEERLGRVSRMGLTAKLFLTVAAVCLFMALGIGFANRMHFATGFLDYLSEQEQARLDAFSEILAEEYAQKNGWEFIRKDIKTWPKLVTRHFRYEAPGKKNDPAIPETERAKRTWQTVHLRSSLGLVDKDKKTLIAGVAPGPSAVWLPVYLDSEVIGWLSREPLTVATENIDVRFQEEQTTAMWAIVGLALTLASGVSIFLARSFLAPVRELAQVTNALTAGDLSARATISTGDELALLSNQLNQLAATLQKNENARRTFMAEISHDLRTPLAILRGEIEAIEDGVRPLTQDSVSSLKAEVTMLSRLVDDIHALALADLGTLAYEKKEVDLVQCLRHCLAPFTERLAKKGISLEIQACPGPLYILGDTDRIGQVFHNLLENSLRYTEAPGIVHVLVRQDDSQASVEILDSAPSVPDTQLDQLFQRFQTGDSSRNRRTSGSGLGLAICKSIVEAHGGTIRALPSPLGGLWVRVGFPVHSVEKAISK